MISIGDKLDDKYMVVGRLGSGGFGEVFLAEDAVIHDRQVALKVLSRDRSGDHSDLIWEMRTLAKFSHPGIVAFHHYFHHEDHLVLVMEYCAGGSVENRLGSGAPISQNDVFLWGAALCEALSFVHGKGIVHHDIKPANILFSQDGAIKLGDFGVANRNAGTQRYLPPEMLLGESVTKTDPRVDVYALGLTLLEMLTGNHPFERLSFDKALQSRIAHDFVPKDLPRWVQEILLRATHPTPELRFQQMRDFAEAIQAKHVPYVFNGNRVKAHAFAELCEAALARKRWKTAEKRIRQAMHFAPDSVTVLVAAGRCHLLLRRTAKAREFFSRALAINPRIHVQKELGWLHLEEGNYPTAISLLSDHLDRNAADFEAYNLLLKCFYLCERYEAGEELARVMRNECPRNSCFVNNGFLCRLLNGVYTKEVLASFDEKDFTNTLSGYNLEVSREEPRSWSKNGSPALRDKLVFQEFGYSVARRTDKQNRLSIRFPDGKTQEFTKSVISLGVLDANDVVLENSSVSRRHAVIVNFPDDVWLYDLGSTYGTRVGGEGIQGRVFLDGVHRVDLGSASIEIFARTGVLV